MPQGVEPQWVSLSVTGDPSKLPMIATYVPVGVTVFYCVLLLFDNLLLLLLLLVLLNLIICTFYARIINER